MSAHDSSPVCYDLPLKALSWYHAVVLAGGFTAAADRLGVGQSAVSHAIRKLERTLGLSLLRRTTRRLVVTPDGEALFTRVDQMLRGMAQTIDELHAQHETGILRVQVLSSLALRWLIARLPDFHDQHPGLRVHLEADDRLGDLNAAGVDVSIRFGTGGRSGEYARLLAQEAVFPVCSPLLAPTANAEVATLAAHRMLYDSTGEHDGSGYAWHRWLEQNAIAPIQGRERVAFGRADLVLQAAVAGQGVALGRSLLVIDDLVAKRLVAPWGRPIPAVFSYYAVMRPQARMWPKVARFVDWLGGQMRDSVEEVAAILDQSPRYRS